MANLQVPISIDPKSLREFQAALKEALINQLEAMTKAYLATVPDDDGGDFYDSYRGHAQRELEGFVDWVKSRVDEPDAPGPAVH